MMSALPGSPAASPHRRARSAMVRADDEIVRGVSAEMLDQPSGQLLEGVCWEGADPDPDSLSAQAFLGCL